MKNQLITIMALVLLASPALAQNSGGGQFDGVKGDLEKQLADSIKELSSLRADIATKKIPLSKQLTDLESQLSEARRQFQDTTRDLDGRNLAMSNLRRKIKEKGAEAHYLSNLLADYMRGFEAKLHIAELKRFEIDLKAAKNALEDESIESRLLYMQQVGLVNLSLTRLEAALGGDSFEGQAVDNDGVVQQGKFTVVGPVALFRSNDGLTVGTSEQRLGSLEPAAIPFSKVEDVDAAANLVNTSRGLIPLDPTMGNAHKIEDTEDTFLEHVQKGGTVMYPIFAMAGTALLIALYKWLSFLFLRKPSRRRTEELLRSVAAGDRDAANAQAKKMKGPVGRMMAAGVEHLDEPKELIEEVMYESVLRTESKLQSMLPFIAICAASAPLLGLLGTVTGIINTFKMITVFGSGDVKSLSGGISEALITTKFGLIVAIPSLLLHAFLSRKAKGVINQMETAAIAFVNRASVQANKKAAAVSDAEIVRSQVNEALADLLKGDTDEETQLAETAK